MARLLSKDSAGKRRGLLRFIKTFLHEKFFVFYKLKKIFLSGWGEMVGCSSTWQLVDLTTKKLGDGGLKIICFCLYSGLSGPLFGFISLLVQWLQFIEGHTILIDNDDRKHLRIMIRSNRKNPTPSENRDSLNEKA